MSTRDLIRHIFRQGPRDKIDEDASPLGVKQQAAEHTTNTACEPTFAQNSQSPASGALIYPPKTPEPFSLEDIAEEDAVNTPSTSETESSTETLASPDLQISPFSTRELVRAALDEAKSAVTSHLDTINTTISLLDALDGFSATISELGKEMLEKKQACEEQMTTLDAVERAVEGMIFAGELQEKNSGGEEEEGEADAK